MIQSTHPAHKVIALIPVSPGRAPFAAADTTDVARLNQSLAGSTVLGQTLTRLSRCEHLEQIVILLDPSLNPDCLAALSNLPDIATVYQPNLPVDDPLLPMRWAARFWSPTAWRGGIAGATCFDEALRPQAMLEALEHFDATAALIAGPDWPLIDPHITSAIIQRHTEQPDSRKITFSQAPPGLAPCLLTKPLLDELASKGAMIGTGLDYQPRYPQADPIAKDPCIQLPPQTRNRNIRAVFDAPRWINAIRHVESLLSPNEFTNLPAEIAARLLTEARLLRHDPLPQQVTLELTTDRHAQGPLAPRHLHHHPRPNRPPITLDTARAIFADLATQPDTALTLAGQGDPLLHPQFAEIVTAAHNAGIQAIHVRTDLQLDPDQPHQLEQLEQLASLPIDILTINLNADTPATYHQLMGRDTFNQTLTHIETLLRRRFPATTPEQQTTSRPTTQSPRIGLPWIVPAFIKTADNLHELETFVDRWTYFTSHALVESPSPANGCNESQQLIPMAPPKRFPCRQLEHRLTILSTGQPALCDQDINPPHPNATHITPQSLAAVTPIEQHDSSSTSTSNSTSTATSAAQTQTRLTPSQAWTSLQAARTAHRNQRFDQLPLCANCHQWHRP